MVICRLLFVMRGSALNRGMNTGIENLAWQLAAEGADVHILAGGLKPSEHGYHLPANVTYHFTGGSGASGDHLPMYRQLRNKLCFDAIIGWIRNIGPLEAIEPINGQRPRFIANEGQTTQPDTSRGLCQRLNHLFTALVRRDRPLKAAWYGTKKEFGARVDAVVAISHAVKRNVAQAYGIPQARIVVIPRGVDSGFFHPASDKERSRLADPPRLLYTGDIGKSKGLGDVAKALSLVRSPVEWVLCGKDQGYLADLRNQIKRGDVDHRLTWAGTLYPEALRTQLHSADCFVFCSWSEVETGRDWGEGLGKSLLEAMSCGLPVIVSNIPTFREIIVDGQNGLMVSVRDPRSIARAIEAYLSDPHLRVHCGLNARKTIENGFDKQAEVEPWKAMLDSR